MRLKDGSSLSKNTILRLDEIDGTANLRYKMASEYNLEKIDKLFHSAVWVNCVDDADTLHTTEIQFNINILGKYYFVNPNNTTKYYEHGFTIHTISTYNALRIEPSLSRFVKTGNIGEFNVDESDNGWHDTYDDARKFIYSELKVINSALEDTGKIPNEYLF